MPLRHGTAAQSLAALDWTNFLLADVQGGIAPFLSIYLLSSLNWQPGMIGLAVSLAGAATLVVQTPAGALIDRIRWKRHLMALAMVTIATASLATALFKGPVPIIAAQIAIGVAGAFLTPMIAALTLGIVGYRRLSRRQGRNQAFNHAGNLFAAVSAGLVAYFIARVAIFYLAAITAMVCIIAIYAIRERDIDHHRARGADTASPAEVATGASLTGLLRDHRVLVYAAAVVLFHFANAAMLPLIGQCLAVGAGHGASLYMSACVIVAQLVMIPIATGAGRFADGWGRRPILLIALACLPVRGLLFAYGTDPYFLVSVQILDGIANGIFGVANILIIADLTRGSGRYNVMQAVIATAIGAGASLSNLIAGWVVDASSYAGGFIFLSSVALAAFALFYIGVPETRPIQNAP